MNHSMASSFGIRQPTAASKQTTGVVSQNADSSHQGAAKSGDTYQYNRAKQLLENNSRIVGSLNLNQTSSKQGGISLLNSGELGSGFEAIGKNGEALQQTHNFNFGGSAAVDHALVDSSLKDSQQVFHSQYARNNYLEAANKTMDYQQTNQ